MVCPQSHDGTDDAESFPTTHYVVTIWPLQEGAKASIHRLHLQYEYLAFLARRKGFRVRTGVSRLEYFE